MKKVNLASQFPNISRVITEKQVFLRSKISTIRLSLQSKLEETPLKLRVFAGFLVITILTAGIVYLSLKTYQTYAKTQEILFQRQKIQEKINFWQSVTQKYEGYKDAYFQMAVLDYQLGNFNKAKLENQKALNLDPNFEDAKKLEEILNK